MATQLNKVLSEMATFAAHLRIFSGVPPVKDPAFKSPDPLIADLFNIKLTFDPEYKIDDYRAGPPEYRASVEDRLAKQFPPMTTPDSLLPELHELMSWASYRFTAGSFEADAQEKAIEAVGFVGLIAADLQLNDAPAVPLPTEVNPHSAWRYLDEIRKSCERHLEPDTGQLLADGADANPAELKK